MLSSVTSRQRIFYAQGANPSNWISRGRDPLTMADQRDLDGHEVFINIEGVPIHTPLTNAEWTIRKIR